MLSNRLCETDVDKGSRGLNFKKSTTRVDVLVETSRDAGSIPAASTTLSRGLRFVKNAIGGSARLCVCSFSSHFWFAVSLFVRIDPASVPKTTPFCLLEFVFFSLQDCCIKLANTGENECSRARGVGRSTTSEVFEIRKSLK